MRRQGDAASDRTRRALHTSSASFTIVHGRVGKFESEITLCCKSCAKLLRHALTPAFGPASHSCSSKVASTTSAPTHSCPAERRCELHGAMRVPRQVSPPFRESFGDGHAHEVRSVFGE